MGKRISGFFIIITAVTVGLRLWSQGLMDVQKFAWLLFFAFLAAVLDSVWVKLILTLFGLGFFLLDYLHYDLNEFQRAAFSVGALLIALFGIYIIVQGVRK
ncbi:MAG: hypothetical protein Q8Q08_01050 [Candidatus Omnitrophota bacterium]|nr:hypothetical protein [Candidatus Omnitrophota bacterium]MDZ4241261.1 hypothetical protein [Candidatus Omnitrophota bacterium]